MSSCVECAEICPIPMKASWVLVFVSALFLTACRQPRPPLEPDSNDYIRMLSKGGWGFDDDIRIDADDSFVSHSYQRGLEQGEVRKGRVPGSYRKLMHLADRLDLWDVTTESLDDEMDALRRKDGLMMVTDRDHVFMELYKNGKGMVADFYAAEQFADHYSAASQIAGFAEMEAAIRQVIPLK